VVACGGFSYGDTLGAGDRAGRAPSLFNPALAEQFQAFFGRQRHLRPGRVQRLPDVCRTEPTSFPARRTWPRFTTNQSEQFEARLSMVEVLESPSLFFARHGRQPPADRRGARRGLCQLHVPRQRATRRSRRCASSTTVGAATEAYPFNPNGSPGGLDRRHHAPTAASPP
jgi:phosphoribosylformylglycinamidine synthase